MVRTQSSLAFLKLRLPQQINLLKITLQNKQRDLSFSHQRVKEAISFVLSKLHITTDEVIVHFVSERAISALHKQFFDDPTSTDCITFPIDNTPKTNHQYHCLGEIFVCPKVALAYAAEHHIPPQTELLRYVIHGLLHLAGYDDLTPKERSRMRRKETQFLKALH